MQTAIKRRTVLFEYTRFHEIGEMISETLAVQYPQKEKYISHQWTNSATVYSMKMLSHKKIINEGGSITVSFTLEFKGAVNVFVVLSQFC